MELTFSKIPKAQVLHYLGVGGEIDDGLHQRINTCIARMTAVCRPRYVWRQFPLAGHGSASLESPPFDFPGEDVKTLLRDCSTVLLFALTMGDAVETLIRQTAVKSQTDALILDACASAACEQSCDDLQCELENRFCKDGIYATDRFSPGYGDLPLSCQPDFLRLLNAEKMIGLTLTESRILIPRKSVTALFGLADRPQGKRVRGCAHCSMKENCSYRKAGNTCGSQN